MKNIIIVLGITVAIVIGYGSHKTAAGNNVTTKNPYAGKWDGRYMSAEGKSVYVAMTVKDDGAIYGFINNPNGINYSFVEMKGSVSSDGALEANYWPEPESGSSGKFTGSFLIKNNKLVFITNDAHPELLTGSEYLLDKAAYTPPRKSLKGVYVLVDYFDSVMANSTSLGDVPSYGTANFFNGGLCGTRTAYNVISMGDLYVAAETMISFTDTCGTQAKTTSTYDQDTVTITYHYIKWCEGEDSPKHSETWIKLSDSSQ